LDHLTQRVRIDSTVRYTNGSVFDGILGQYSKRIQLEDSIIRLTMSSDVTLVNAAILAPIVTVCDVFETEIRMELTGGARVNTYQGITAYVEESLLLEACNITVAVSWFKSSSSGIAKETGKSVNIIGCIVDSSLVGDLENSNQNTANSGGLFVYQTGDAFIANSTIAVNLTNGKAVSGGICTTTGTKDRDTTLTIWNTTLTVNINVSTPTSLAIGGIAAKQYNSSTIELHSMTIYGDFK